MGCNVFDAVQDVEIHCKVGTVAVQAYQTVFYIGFLGGDGVDQVVASLVALGIEVAVFIVYRHAFEGLFPFFSSFTANTFHSDAGDGFARGEDDLGFMRASGFGLVSDGEFGIGVAQEQCAADKEMLHAATFA